MQPNDPCLPRGNRCSTEGTSGRARICCEFYKYNHERAGVISGHLGVCDGAKLWDCFVLTELETEAVPPAGRSRFFLPPAGKSGDCSGSEGRIRSDGGRFEVFFVLSVSVSEVEWRAGISQ